MIDMRAEEPTPTSEPNAWMMFMIGMVIAKPAMAMAPTHCPKKTRSQMLYTEAMIWLTIEGMAYAHNNFLMSWVSSSLVLSICSM